MEKKKKLESLRPLALKAAQVLKATAQVANEKLSAAMRGRGDKQQGPDIPDWVAPNPDSVVSAAPQPPADLDQPGKVPQTETPGPVTADQPTETGWVRFEAIARTAFGQTVWVVGSAPALGAWNPERAVQLITTDYPKWSERVQVETREPIEYKYLRKNGDGSFSWETLSGNRVLKDFGAATYAASVDEVSWGD